MRDGVVWLYLIFSITIVSAVALLRLGHLDRLSNFVADRNRTVEHYCPIAFR